MSGTDTAQIRTGDGFVGSNTKNNAADAKQALQKQAENLRTEPIKSDPNHPCKKEGNEQQNSPGKRVVVPPLEIGGDSISAKLKPYGEEIQDACKRHDLKALLDERKKLNDLVESSTLGIKDSLDAKGLLKLADGAWEKLKAISIIQASANLDQQTIGAMPGDTEEDFKARMQYRQQALDLISKMSLESCAGGTVLERCAEKIPGEKAMRPWEIYLEKQLDLYAGNSGWLTLEQATVCGGFLQVVPHPRAGGGKTTGSYLIDLDRHGDNTHDSNVLISHLKEATDLAPAVFLRHLAFMQGQDRFRGEAELTLQGLILPENWAQTKDATVKQDFEKLQKREGEALTAQMADLAKKFANKELNEDQFKDQLAKAEASWTKQFAEKTYNYVNSQKNAGRLQLSGAGEQAFHELDGMYSGGDARKEQWNHWIDVVAVDGTMMAMSGGFGNLARAGAKVALERYIAKSIGEEALKRGAIRAGVYLTEKTAEGYVFTGAQDLLQAAGGNKHAFDNFWLSGVTSTVSFMGMHGSGKLASNVVFAAAEKTLPKETQALLNAFLKGEEKQLFLSQVIQSNAKLRALNASGQLTAQALYLAIQGQGEAVIAGKPVTSLLSAEEWAQALGHSTLEVASLKAGHHFTKGVTESFNSAQRTVETRSPLPLPNLTIEGQDKKETPSAPQVVQSDATPQEKKTAKETEPRQVAIPETGTFGLRPQLAYPEPAEDPRTSARQIDEQRAREQTAKSERKPETSPDDTAGKPSENVFAISKKRAVETVFKTLQGQLAAGTLTANNFPQDFLELERAIPPNSPEGRQFQAEMEKVLQRLVADPAFHEKSKTNPIQFVLTDTGEPNAYIIPTEKSTLMVFDKSLFPTFENLNQLAFVTYHELTHLKVYDLLGEGSNSQIEEAGADARPIVMMANLSTPEIPNGLNMQEARKWMKNFTGKHEVPPWMAMIDAHPLPHYRDDVLENTLAGLRQLQGTKGASENKAIVPMPESLLKVTESARHTSCIQSQLGPDFEKLSSLDQLKKIEGLLPSLSDQYHVRAEDLSNVVRKLNLDPADETQFKLASEIADKLLNNPCAFNDLFPALNKAIFEKAEYYPEGRISEIANDVDDFIKAKNPVVMQQLAKSLQGTLGTIPVNEIWWQNMSLDKFALKSRPEYKSEMGQSKDSVEDVLMPWDEHVKAAVQSHSSDMYRTLWSLGVVDPRLASTASREDIQWYLNNKDKFLSYPSSPSGDIVAYQLRLDSAGTLIGIDAEIPKNPHELYRNLLGQRLVQLPDESRRASTTRAEGSEAPKPADLANNPASVFERMKEKLEAIAVTDGDRTGLENRCRQLTQLTDLFDGSLKDPSSPDYAKAREAIRSFFLDTSLPLNYQEIYYENADFEEGMKIGTAISYLPLVDFIARDDHKLFTPQEKGELLNIGSPICAELAFWRKAFEYKQPQNLNELETVLTKLGSATTAKYDEAVPNTTNAAATEMALYLKTHNDPSTILDLIVKHPDAVAAAAHYQLFEIKGIRVKAVEDKIMDAIEAKPVWPSDPVSLYKIYQFSLEHHLLENEHHRDDFTNKITESFAQIPERSVRIATAEKILLSGKEVPDALVRKALISDWAKLVGSQLGHDDGSAAYANKISPVIQNVGQNAVFNIRYEMLRQLDDAVLSQRNVSFESESAIYQKYGRSQATNAGQLFGAGQAIYQALCSDNRQESVVDFLMSAGKRDDITAFADDSMKELSSMTNWFEASDANFAVARIQAQRMYEDFWSAPLPLRAMVMKELLMPPSLVKSEAGREKLFGEASERCINELLPQNVKYAKEGRSFLQAFLAKGVLDENSRPVFLSALMAAKQSTSGQGDEVGVGQRLATLLDQMGPAWKKLGQAIASHPSTPSEIATDMEPLKGKIDTPRWQMWALYEGTVPQGLRDQYPNLGAVKGAASFFTTVDAHDSVFSMLTPYGQERAKDGFATMERFIQELSTGKYDIGKAIPQSVAEMVHSARVSAALETNAKVGAATADAMTNRYAGTTVNVNGTPYSVSSAQWYNYGPEFRHMQKMPGDVFNDAAKNASGDPSKTAQVHDQAVAVVAIETAHDLDGGPVDRDRHGRNFVVDGNKIGMFDMGATHAIIKDKDGHVIDPTNAKLVDDVLDHGGTITVHEPSKAEREMIGNTLVELFKAMKNGKPLAEVMHDQIEQVRNKGGDPEYLILVERGILARQDCMRMLDSNGGDLHNIFAGIYQSGGKGSLIHPEIRKILETRVAAGELGEAEGLASLALAVTGLTGNKGRIMLSKYLEQTAQDPVVISKAKAAASPKPTYWPMPKNTNSLQTLSTPDQLVQKPKVP